MVIFFSQRTIIRALTINNKNNNVKFVAKQNAQKSHQSFTLACINLKFLQYLLFYFNDLNMIIIIKT